MTRRLVEAVAELEDYGPEPPEQDLRETHRSVRPKLTASEVKDALRKHHPGQNDGGYVGQWVCIEEWCRIDLLALDAWREGRTIGYEVKVSRGDMRTELLNPDKRAEAVGRCTQFYFAVPRGMLKREEIEWEQPADWTYADFQRPRCAAGCFLSGGRRGRKQVAVRIIEGRYELCPDCGGKGTVSKSRAELEAPILWVPPDMGLVEVDGGGVHVTKRAPKTDEPDPIFGRHRTARSQRQAVNDLVRWVSHRPDPRH